MGLMISFLSRACFQGLHHCICQTRILSPAVYTCYDIPQQLGWGYFRATIKSLLFKMFSSLNCSPLHRETFHTSLESVFIIADITCFHISARLRGYSVFVHMLKCCCSCDVICSSVVLKTILLCLCHCVCVSLRAGLCG